MIKEQMMSNAKLNLMASIVSGILFSTSLNAQEAVVFNDVKSSFPKIEDIKDQELLIDFLKTNFHHLKPSTVAILSRMLSAEPARDSEINWQQVTFDDIPDLEVSIPMPMQED